MATYEREHMTTGAQGEMGTMSGKSHGAAGTMGGYGKVVITVKSAHNLKDTAWIGKADPYCQIKVADASIETRSVKNAGTFADWNESFAFNNVSPDDIVSFYVYDKNMLKDNLMGEGQINLRHVFESETWDTRIPLTNRSGTKDVGEIMVSMRMEGASGRGAGMMEKKGMEYETTTTTTRHETAPMTTTERAPMTTTEGGVCGQEYFSRTEDVPVVKERVERLVEHHPRETHFVREVRPVGVTEHPVQVESGGVQERVVSAAEPKSPCEL